MTTSQLPPESCHQSLSSQRAWKRRSSNGPRWETGDSKVPQAVRWHRLHRPGAAGPLGSPLVRCPYKTTQLGHAGAAGPTCRCSRFHRCPTMVFSRTHRRERWPKPILEFGKLHMMLSLRDVRYIALQSLQCWMPLSYFLRIFLENIANMKCTKRKKEIIGQTYIKKELQKERQ